MKQLVVIVPAHNEEDQIAATLTSLLAQSVPATQIVVVSDNSSDRTVEIARTFPVTVMETVDNPHRKAGALNQAWTMHCQDSEYVFTMDADTILSPDFFALAIARMETDTDLGGASACPMLKPLAEGSSRWNEMLWRLARLDFGGYMRILARWKFSPEVLSGYGAIFRNSALNRIAKSRFDLLPWATESIVEDYRISLDLRKYGYTIAIIPAALAYTDTPMTVRTLWTQRIRWAGGTWQELAKAGWQPYTRRAWQGVALCTLSAALRVLALVMWVAVIALGLPLSWSWIWAVPLGLAVLDRLDITRYTKNSDWRDIVLILAFLPMEFLSILREAWTIRSAWLTLRRRKLTW
jgi:cellulose synthase/poly-beta-1,6-N-acetylglucosamine synthase-like glycosyltransferase